jgi:hypothetical protein
MGTFGLCDYLNQRDISAQILNLALYEGAHQSAVLKGYLGEYCPSHVGLIFHWQETLEGLLRVAREVKRRAPEIETVCGGMTAGYFGPDLLRKCAHIDYVIKGDPERPMERLLKGAHVGEIPNLVYRDRAGVQANEVSFFADEETLSSISFSRLPDLLDYELYLQAIEKKLGFPLFIGRGCPFGCEYCGGSRKAFWLHSGRPRPVVRSIPSVIADLRSLKAFTRRIYLCYETDRFYIKTLFEAMKREQDLVKEFSLNYGAWELPDREFLELYKDLFILDRDEKSLFELSPEVFGDKSRREIKHQETYSIKELVGNLHLIFRILKDSVKVYLFFSRYHVTAQTYAAVREEILRIFQLKHTLIAHGLVCARVFYDHLSTDVGSRYWERYVRNSRDLDTLVSWSRRLKNSKGRRFPVDNLCIYTPEGLSEKDLLTCELLIHLLKSLERDAHALFHILFQCLDGRFVDLLEAAVEAVLADGSKNPFKDLDLHEVLFDLKEAIHERPSLLSRIPFIEDLARLHMRKLRGPEKGHRSRDASERGSLKLNQNAISVHDHDYLDLSGFLKRLKEEGPEDLTPEKTVYIFLVDEILTMPLQTYDMTIRAFERGSPPDQYYTSMARRGIFDLSYHQNLIARLVESNVLC